MRNLIRILTFGLYCPKYADVEDPGDEITRIKVDEDCGEHYEVNGKPIQSRWNPH